jgi:hypothetical protein
MRSLVPLPLAWTFGASACWPCFFVAHLRLLLCSVTNLSRFSQPHHVHVILVLSIPYPVVLTRFRDFFYNCRHLGTFSWFAFSYTICFFLDVYRFPKSWDASLCSFLVIFFLFLSSLVGKFFCYGWFLILSTRHTKNRVILGNYHGWLANNCSRIVGALSQCKSIHIKQEVVKETSFHKR